MPGASCLSLDTLNPTEPAIFPLIIGDISVNERIQPPASASRIEESGHHTWHLAPFQYWQTQRDGAHYLPERFAEEGFIHCTDTVEEVIAVGNRFYRSDPRSYVLLDIACDAVEAPIVYEDENRIFPHIYGPLPIAAVIRVLSVERDNDGQFRAIHEIAV